MFLKQVLVSIFEFGMTVVMSVLVVFVTYRAMAYTNPDYDTQAELKKGNVAVAILLGALLFASGMMVQKGFTPVISLFRMYIMSPLQESVSNWRMALHAVSHLAMSFILSVTTISFSLRMFGKLNKDMKMGQELKKGNVAVGIILAAVILVVAMYVSEGIGSISRALIPQPSIGRVRIMR